jgi:hypothetical protein
MKSNLIFWSISAALVHRLVIGMAMSSELRLAAHIKDHLLDRLQNPTRFPVLPYHLNASFQQLAELLRSCKRQHVSSSIFVFGNAAGGRSQVIERAIATEYQSDVRVARLKGLMDDEDTIFSIASQLCVRNDRSYDSALKDIVAQMKVRICHGFDFCLVARDTISLPADLVRRQHLVVTAILLSF